MAASSKLGQIKNQAKQILRCYHCKSITITYLLTNFVKHFHAEYPFFRDPSECCMRILYAALMCADK